MHQPCIAIIFLCLDDLYLCHIADECILNKQRVSVNFTDTRTVMAHILDTDLIYFIFFDLCHSFLLF